MKRQEGFGLIGVLLIIGAFVLSAGGVVVWEKKMNTVVTPILTPTPSPKTKIQVSPALINSEKMPWEDSVCGNGICEQCESRSECCNFPCTIDPITGNQMCPPPTCVGWCEKDCESVTQPKVCKADADCYDAQGNPTGICNVPCQDKAICQNGICVKPMMNLPGIQ